MKKPTIVIDGIFFQLYTTGIARVWQSLLQEWAIQEFAQHLLILDRDDKVPKIPNIQYRWFPPYSYKNLQADREMLQQVCDEEEADLFISTYFTVPLTTPSVFMAYDMIPEALGAALDVPEWQEKHYCIQYASAYIAISHNTAQDLIKFFSTIAPQTITVAYPGVSTNIFFPATTEEIQSFRAKYDITKPYFLLTAVNKNYKNNLLFFAAFSQLQNQQDFEVICIGTDTELKPELKAYVTGTTVHLLPLSDAELRIAYSDALALVYPSLYEGFGLPVLEAMVCGCPVITCPNASLPEVGGEAVLYVNDRDVEGMANALHEVQKPSVREALVNAGLARSRHFSWSTMAAIVQSALVDATLLPLQLRAVNLIAFPDWHLPEDTLLQDLETAIRAVFTAADRGNITLLIYTGTVDSEIASFAISDVTLNLLMAEELPEETMPEISLVPTLSEMQWKALIPRIQGRIGLKNEDKAAIALAGAEAL